MVRRLAVILIADVVDYSRLMGEDETRTLAALAELRQVLFEPVVANHGGTVIKRMGDGWIVEYPNVSEAVACAIDIQERLSSHDIIRLRIGVHIGDVTFQDDDIYGDGINVASRLEALAQPGHVLISDTVHQSLDNKATEKFCGGEAQQLKNVTRPVGVWRWPAVSGSIVGSSDDDGNATLPLPDKPSIAVLPFNNMSGDPEQEYFADGISEDIITDLSKIAGLFIIARNSSFVYKGRAVDVPTVAKELGVRYILEGSVRRGGNRVRINAQLIDAETGGHLWADRYDRDITDIFAVQDEVTASIVQALALTLGADERRRIGNKGTDNLAAYEYVLRGRELFLSTRLEDKELAKQVLAQAIELDPSFGAAHGFLALTHMLDYVNGLGDDPEASRELAFDLAKRGAALTPDDAHVHIALGSVLLSLRRHEEAIAEAQRAIELEPNYAYGFIELGWYLQYAGRADEALEHFDRGLKLDPHCPDAFLHFMAQAYFQLGRYKEASDLLRRRLVRNPTSDSSRMLLAACYGYLNELGAARKVWDEIKQVNPDFSIEQRRQVLPYKYPEDFEKIVTGLRKAGLPEE